MDVEDLLVRVKNGAEPELGEVAREVARLAQEGRLGEDDDEDGLLVPALLARLAGAGDAEARVSVMAALRRLAGCAGGGNKVRALLLCMLVEVWSFWSPARFVFDGMLYRSSWLLGCILRISKAIFSVGLDLENTDSLLDKSPFWCTEPWNYKSCSRLLVLSIALEG